MNLWCGHSGRVRRKRIRAMSRLGAVVCYQRFVERRRRLRKMEELKAPEVLLARDLSMVFDAAEAVRTAVPLITSRDHWARLLKSRDGLAGRGVEWTPAEFEKHLLGAVASLRAALEGPDMPVPRDNRAALELFMAMLNEARAAAAGGGA